MSNTVTSAAAKAVKAADPHQIATLEKAKAKYLALSTKYRALAITSGLTFQAAKSKAYDALSKKAWKQALAEDKKIAKLIKGRAKGVLKDVGALGYVEGALGYLGIEDTGAAWYQSRWVKGAGVVAVIYAGYKYVKGK